MRSYTVTERARCQCGLVQAEGSVTFFTPGTTTETTVEVPATVELPYASCSECNTRASIPMNAAPR